MNELLKANILFFIRKLQCENLKNLDEFRWLMNIIGPIEDKVILDLCGASGLWGLYLKQHYNPNFRYTLMDIDKQYVWLGEWLFSAYGYKDDDFITGDVNKPFPFPNDSFDIILLFNWWTSHADKKMVDEVKRVLKHEGLLFVNYREQDRYLFEDFILVNCRDIDRDINVNSPPFKKRTPGYRFTVAKLINRKVS